MGRPSGRAYPPARHPHADGIRLPVAPRRLGAIRQEGALRVEVADKVGVLPLAVG